MHITALGFGAINPAAQEGHFTAAKPGLKVPGAQSRHRCMPRLGAYLPGGQSGHALSTNQSGLAVPAAHGWHWPAG